MFVNSNEKHYSFGHVYLCDIASNTGELIRLATFESPISSTFMGLLLCMLWQTACGEVEYEVPNLNAIDHRSVGKTKARIVPNTIPLPLNSEKSVQL